MKTPFTTDPGRVSPGSVRADSRPHTSEPVDQLSGLRAGLEGVSSVLKAACEMEGVSLGAVAYGILPEPHLPFNSDGTPWLPCDHPVRLEASPYARPKNWHQRPQGAGFPYAYVRTRAHPAGRWRVRLVRGVVHFDMESGPLWLRSARTHCVAMLDATVSETALVAAVGRPVGAFIGHPLLFDQRYEVLSAEARDGLLIVRFACPVEPLTIDELTGSDGGEQHLGRNASLPDDEAIVDLVLRCAASLSSLSSLPPFRGVPPLLVHEVVAERVRTLNLMSPPWVGLLKQPSPAEVSAILRNRAAV